MSSTYGITRGGSPSAAGSVELLRAGAASAERTVPDTITGFSGLTLSAVSADLVSPDFGIMRGSAIADLTGASGAAADLGAVSAGAAAGSGADTAAGFAEVVAFDSGAAGCGRVPADTSVTLGRTVDSGVPVALSGSADSGEAVGVADGMDGIVSGDAVSAALTDGAAALVPEFVFSEGATGGPTGTDGFSAVCVDVSF